MIETVLHSVRLLANILLLLSLADSGSLLVQTLLLLSLGLWSVLVEELESLGGGVAVENVGELGDGTSVDQRYLMTYSKSSVPIGARPARYPSDEVAGPLHVIFDKLS